MPVQDAMVVLRKTASAALNYITRCCTPDEVRPAAEFFDIQVVELVCDIQRIQKSELPKALIDEIFSPLLMGGTYGHCIHSASDSSGDSFSSLDCNGTTHDEKDIG